MTAVLAPSCFRFSNALTLQCEISRDGTTSLSVTDQPQYYTKAGGSEKPAILCIRDLPYLYDPPCQRMLFPFIVKVLTSPNIVAGNFVFSKNFTATSPVTTPILSVSAAEKSWPKYRLSSGVR